MGATVEHLVTRDRAFMTWYPRLITDLIKCGSTLILNQEHHHLGVTIFSFYCHPETNPGKNYHCGSISPEKLFIIIKSLITREMW